VAEHEAVTQRYVSDSKAMRAALKAAYEQRITHVEAERDDLATTLRLRSEALNRVGEENEALRARLAKVEAVRDSWITETARDECRCGGCDGCTARVMAHDLSAALADQEAP